MVANGWHRQRSCKTVEVSDSNFDLLLQDSLQSYIHIRHNTASLLSCTYTWVLIQSSSYPIPCFNFLRFIKLFLAPEWMYSEVSWFDWYSIHEPTASALTAFLYIYAFSYQSLSLLVKDLLNWLIPKQVPINPFSSKTRYTHDYIHICLYLPLFLYPWLVIIEASLLVILFLKFIIYLEFIAQSMKWLLIG